MSAGAGSGFVWDKAGHILTNAHVVSGADQVFVRFGSDRPFVAKVVGAAPEYDVAVLRIDVPLKGLTRLPLGLRPIWRSECRCMRLVTHSAWIRRSPRV